MTSITVDHLGRSAATLRRVLARISVALILVLGSQAVDAGPANSLPVNFKLKGLYGGTIRAKDMRDQVVVLQFWASWCKGCGKVMRQIADLSDRTSRDHLFVPVSVDETVTEARSYFRFQKPRIKPLKKRSYLDVDARLATQLGIEAVPAIVVVGSDGRVLSSISGHPNKRQLRKIKRLLVRK